MSSEDSTPPTGDGPRFTAPGGNPPGVRTAGEIAADSDRTGADGAAGDAGETGSGTAAAEPGSGESPAAQDKATSPAADPKAAKQAAREEKKNARAEKKAAKAEDSTNTKKGKDTKTKKPVASVRSRVAALIWAVAVICALVLAVGALIVALKANQDNAAVGFVLQAADALDLGVFSRENGIFEFSGADPDVRNALVNWGLGAVAYLVVGKILDRLVSP